MLNKSILKMLAILIGTFVIAISVGTIYKYQVMDYYFSWKYPKEVAITKKYLSLIPSGDVASIRKQFIPDSRFAVDDDLLLIYKKILAKIDIPSLRVVALSQKREANNVGTFSRLCLNNTHKCLDVKLLQIDDKFYLGGIFFTSDIQAEHPDIFNGF